MLGNYEKAEDLLALIDDILACLNKPGQYFPTKQQRYVWRLRADVAGMEEEELMEVFPQWLIDAGGVESATLGRWDDILDMAYAELI